MTSRPLIAGALLAIACSTPTKSVVTKTAEQPQVIQRVMRGAARLGCDAGDLYDDMIGLIIDCPDGRVVVGKPTGENTSLMTPNGPPLEVTCFDGMAEQCEAFWKKLNTAGDPACGSEEAIAGCGELKCMASGPEGLEADPKEACSLVFTKPGK